VNIEDGRFDTSRGSRLNNPERIKELRPAELLKDVAGLAPGMTCIDIGSGTGVFSSRMVEIVGSGGMVYAVDNSAAMLDHLRLSNPPVNLKLVQADAASTGLDSECADVCLAAFILHEVDSPEGVLAEAFRLLKPRGLAVVVEWRIDTSHGPPRHIRISVDKVKSMFKQVGLLYEQHANWSINHYVITGRKPQ
jgi:ubiquinone/menaquinone biosynthesis C-methylase UbiE